MEPDLAAIGPQQPLTAVLRSSARWRSRLARVGREDARSKRATGMLVLAELISEGQDDGIMSELAGE
jgi:hypothetical protein